MAAPISLVASVPPTATVPAVAAPPPARLPASAAATAAFAADAPRPTAVPRPAAAPSRAASATRTRTRSASLGAWPSLASAISVRPSSSRSAMGPPRIARATTGQRLRELDARQPQARVHGVEGRAQKRGDLGSAQLLHLGQHEHVAAVVVQAVEEPLEETRRLVLGGVLVGAVRRIDQEAGVDAPVLEQQVGVL